MYMKNRIRRKILFEIAVLVMINSGCSSTANDLDKMQETINYVDSENNEFLFVGQSDHKEPSDGVISQAEEETANIKPDAIAKPEESENRKEVIKCEHILSGSMWQYYTAEEIPFVDEETFELIKEAYEEVDYSVKFEKGNPEVYEEYKQKFWYLFQNKAPFLDRKTGKELYIKDWFESRGNGIKNFYFYFFDMNGDDLPELYVDCYGQISVFAYDPDTDQYMLWTCIDRMEIIGTRKGVWNPEFDIDICEFFQLDSDGNLELNTLFWAEYADLYHDDINMVMFPNYADREKRWEITEEMKQQGVLEESSGQWFFKITDEQFEELARPYMEALKLARERCREERYTYEQQKQQTLVFL